MQLTNGVAPQSVVTTIANSTSAHRFIARQLYREILGRNPTSLQVGTGADVINKQGYLAYEVRLFSSTTFAHAAGATPAKLVNALLRNPLMLGKTPPPSWLKAWTVRMKLQPHASVITAMLKSTGVMSQQVQAAATAALGTPLTPSDVTSWTAALVSAKYSVPLLLAVKLSSTAVLQTYGVTVTNSAG
jgi:hypothetical protein